MPTENKILLALAAIFTVARFYVARLIGVFFIVLSPHDDHLMMSYSHLYGHFVQQEFTYNIPLMKDMGFPLFIQIVARSGISYVDWLTILWVLVAALMTYLFVISTDCKNKKIWLLVYIFTLFIPIAFGYTGRRLYRQSFLSPMYFLTFELIVIMFVISWKKIEMSLKRKTALSVILGGVFTLTYYVKEDGIWLLICLVTAALASLVGIILNGEKIAKNALLIVLPLIIFNVSTVFYKSVNEHFFGVYLINNRTEGQLGQFVKNAYKIKSPNRTSKIWAPPDVVEKMFEVSPTLAGQERLKDFVLHTGWCRGDMKENPVKGDFLTWVMLVELCNSGTCKTATEQEEFLGKVNQEIDEAFKNGKLEKEDKIQLVSSMGGYSWAEIWELRELILQIYQSHLLTEAYDSELDKAQALYPPNGEEEFKEVVRQVSKTLNWDLTKESNNVEERKKVATGIFTLYKVLNTILFAAAIIAMFKKLKDKINYVICAGFLILSLAYALAISWFSYFIGWGAAVYYSNGIVPMLTIFEILGSYRLIGE